MRKNALPLKLSRTLGILLLTLLVLHSCQKETTVQDNSDQPSLELRGASNAPHVPNQLLVKFKEGTSPSAVAAALARVQGKVEEKILTAAMKNSNLQQGVLVVNTPLQALNAVSRIRGQEVESAEPNYIYSHDAASNDTYYANGSLWGMYGDASSPANQYGSQAAEAWARGNTGSSSVYIGIIDEGYMYTHEDLAANAGVNPGEVANNGLDDDNNGYVDDVYGWDFDGNNNSVFDGVDDDHGTHVAGTIGGVGGNALGVAGVVWNVKLLSGKFLGKRGGTTANAIKAVDYFTDLKTRHGLNIVATNNSWGGGGASNQLQAAIERANTAEILFIASAGNATNNNDASPSYPASYPNANIIAVASITSTGGISSFSNYGATSVDLGAPGSGIYSTVPVRSGKNTVSGYASYSGTSMASPHVTGAAALYAYSHPGANASSIKNAILSSVTGTASLSGKTATGGRLNVSGF